MFKEAPNGSWRKFAFILKMAKINISFTISKTRTATAKAARKKCFPRLYVSHIDETGNHPSDQKYAKSPFRKRCLIRHRSKFP